MSKYTELSDFEINKKVAINIGGFALSLMVFDDQNGIVKKNIPNIGLRVFTEFNPCNNPADAMPIIIENKIGLSPMYHSNKWTADCLDYDFMSVNKNPCRGAMEVFLMMKDAENN
ncbi:phage protein NinX family protein [Providencia rettgeri]